MESRSKRSPLGISEAITAMALAQFGVVSSSQLRAAGISGTSIHNRVRAASLHPVCRGVLALGGYRFTDESFWMAGVLAAGPGAMLSGAAAAALHGFASWNGIVDVRRESGNNQGGKRIRPPTGRSRPLTLRRFRTEEARGPILVKGIATASPVQSLLDLAETWEGSKLKWAFVEADRLGCLDEAGFKRLLGPNRGYKGAVELRRLASVRLPRLENAESLMEGLVLDIFVDFRVPIPEVNCPIGEYRADFVWREERLILEADGGFHRGQAKQLDDRARENDLVRKGWAILRYDWWDVTEDRARVAETVKRSLEQRRPIKVNRGL